MTNVLWREPEHQNRREVRGWQALHALRNEGVSHDMT
jgi:hypothetical protein